MRKPRTNRSKRTRGLAPAQRERWLLEGATLVALIVVIIGVFFLSAIQYFVIRSGQAAAVISAVLVDLANGDRATNSLGGLTMNPRLVVAAQAKADDMAAKGYFAHKAPDGKDSWYWFKEAGYSFSYAGENLAVDFSDSADVERAWMNSPTHRENLLDPHFTEIGIAVAQGTFQGRATTFVVQMFGTPAEAATITTSIQEITTPQDATEPALATTQPASPNASQGRPTPINVLGTSLQEPAAQEASLTSETVAPIADMHTSSVEAPVGAIARYAPAWGFLATSPKTTLRWAYYVLGFLVLFALFITTGLELRFHHRRAFMVAACLLVFMSGLFVVADYAIFSEPVLADSTTSTSSGQASSPQADTGALAGPG